MNEYTIEFREGLEVGLRHSDKNPKNVQALVRSDSVFYETGILRNTDEISTMDLTALGCTWPFPQIFDLKSFKLICTETEIYKLSGGSLTLVFTALEGSTWTMADFDTFLVFTNGRVLATLDPVSGIWSQYFDCAIPACLCVCNLNGQLLVGGPEVTISAGFLG